MVDSTNIFIFIFKPVSHHYFHSKNSLLQDSVHLYFFIIITLDLLLLLHSVSNDLNRHANKLLKTIKLCEIQINS